MYMQFKLDTLSLWRIVAIVLAVVAVLFASIQPPTSTDFWLQAKIGELIVQDHAIPKTLLFPFTGAQNLPFHSHEWLPSVLFYGLLECLGQDAMGLVLGGIALVFFGVMVRLAYQRSQGAFAASLLLGLVAITVENFRNVLRPELLSLILLGLYVHALDAFRSRANYRSVVTSLVIVVVWANTHGSYFLAPLVAGMFAAGIWLDQWRNNGLRGTANPVHFLGLALGALACSLLNNSGLESWRFVFNFSLGHSIAVEPAARDFVTEWLPAWSPVVREQRGLWIGLGCLILTAGLLLPRWRKVSSVDLLLFGAFVVLSLDAIRFLVYLGLVAALVLAPQIPLAWRETRGQIRLYIGIVMFGITSISLIVEYGTAQYGRPHSVPSSYVFTEQMVKALGDPSLRGNVLTTLELGGELVYRAYPRLRPSIDPRIDSYGGNYYLGHEHLFVDDSDLHLFLTQYQVKYLLLDRRRFSYLMSLPSWAQGHYKTISKDHKAILLEYLGPGDTPPH